MWSKTGAVAFVGGLGCSSRGRTESTGAPQACGPATPPLPHLMSGLLLSPMSPVAQLLTLCLGSPCCPLKKPIPRCPYKQGQPLLGWRQHAPWPSGTNGPTQLSGFTVGPCRLSCPLHLTHEEMGWGGGCGTPQSQSWEGAGQARCLQLYRDTQPD